MQRNEQITNQAKKIMDSFVTALSQANVSSEEYGVKRPIQTREAIKKESSTKFREKIFKNAPNHTHEYIVTEKKKW